MSMEASNDAPARVLAQEPELLECLRKIGKGLIASGSSVGVVENTLTEIAQAYEMDCEIVALPNILMIKVGAAAQELLDFTVQRATTLQLNQISELVELVDQVQHKRTLPGEASRQVDRILAKPPRYHWAVTLFAYVVSTLGLTLRFRPDLQALVVTGVTGLLVGVLVLSFRRWPRFNLLLPVTAAIVVSTIVFQLTKLGLVFGSTNLIITPLVTFLPGAILTTGMIELASMQLISGSARLMYGAAALFLLFMGIAGGFSLTNVPHMLVSTFQASGLPWWAPVLGTLLFGIGTFVRLSGANRDLFWMLLVLYIAMAAQTVGEGLGSSYFGVFLAATLMALSSELIARSPRRTPAQASQMLAFWFLVPGTRGLLSVTSLLSRDYQTALIGLGEMLVLIVSIALGVLLGTLIVSPRKFVPVTARARRLEARGT
jgi:uncharacterized membrane protein YjjP (DUF1212 family)/uncharacterized membrane protein YjjB (DUF3815 family)